MSQAEGNLERAETEISRLSPTESQEGCPHQWVLLDDCYPYTRLHLNEKRKLDVVNGQKKWTLPKLILAHCLQCIFQILFPLMVRQSLHHSRSIKTNCQCNRKNQLPVIYGEYKGRKRRKTIHHDSLLLWHANKVHSRDWRDSESVAEFLSQFLAQELHWEIEMKILNTLSHKQIGLLKTQPWQ